MPNRNRIFAWDNYANFLFKSTFRIETRYLDFVPLIEGLQLLYFKVISRPLVILMRSTEITVKGKIYLYEKYIFFKLYLIIFEIFISTFDLDNIYDLYRKRY